MADVVCRVFYNNEEIAGVAGNKIATLCCSGKKMKDDITLYTSGGGAEFNIAYGDTAPEDTSKLWVKTSEPSGVIVSPNAEKVTAGGHSVETLPDTLPAVLSHGAIGMVGSKVYLFGSHYRQAQGTNQKQIMWYDIDTGEKGIEPVELEKNTCTMGYATIGSKIYLFGGMSRADSLGSPYSDITCYDTETQTLVTLAPTLATMQSGKVVCAEQDGLIYVFGGRKDNGGAEYNVYLFDPEAQTLEVLANLGSSCLVVGGFAHRIENDIYVFDNYMGNNVIHFNTVSCSGEAHALKATDGKAYYVRNNFGHGVVRGKIYAIGTVEHPTEIAIFDPVNCVIESTVDIGTIPTFRYPSCVSVNGEIYIFGGQHPTEYTVSSTIRKYKGSEMLPLVSEGTLYIEPNSDSTVVPIINTEAARVEIGVGGVFKGNTDGIGEKVKKAIYKDGTWTNI